MYSSIVLSALILAAPRPQETQVPEQVTAVRALFLTNCAACHGPLGDGEGVTDLDRKARSFKDGGFSYGNTPKAVMRSITSGIPGTPMPSFSDALSAEQIEELAAYVIELGPGLPPEPENTELVVRERALVVRGLLPPIVEGTPQRPRGLLIGTPAGLTFEYRTDDVRLLGVRQGGFVDRRDWVGRGGSGLQPLGTVVSLVGNGDPGPSFQARQDGEWVPLRARLKSTRTIGADGIVAYMLQDEEGADVCHVQERCTPDGSWLGSGYRRVWILRCGERDIDLAPRSWNDGKSPWVRTDALAGIQRRDLEQGGVEVGAWLLLRDGRLSPAPSASQVDSQDASATYALHLAAREVVRLEVVRVAVPAGATCPLNVDPAARQLFEELTR